MEDFEQKYNFRFEEGTGAYITTHQREVEDSMRRKDDKRKDKRLEKKERFEEEKRRKQEELNQLKQLKKDEILEKVRKAEFISGTKIVDEASGESKRMLERMEKELKTDFIPELYDKAMEKVFDEKYYEASDQEGKKAARAKDLNLKLIKDEDIKEQGEEEEEENDNIEEIFERELIKPLKKQVEKKLEDQEAGE
jgi:protein KRI1